MYKRQEEIKEPVTSGGAAKAQTMSSEEIDTSHIKYGYCTEFIIMLEKEYNAEIEAKFKEFLTSIGDSLVVVSDDEIVKVHVHTNHPGLAFEKGLEYGSLTSMKVDLSLIHILSVWISRRSLISQRRSERMRRPFFHMKTAVQHL